MPGCTFNVYAINPFLLVDDHGSHWNPLWKVQEVIDVIRQRLQAGWILGE